MSKDLQVVDTEHNITNKYRAQDRNMVPGFSTTAKTRPLVIAKMEEYTRVRKNVFQVQSRSTLNILLIFIYPCLYITGI